MKNTVKKKNLKNHRKEKRITLIMKINMEFRNKIFTVQKMEKSKGN